MVRSAEDPGVLLFGVFDEGMMSLGAGERLGKNEDNACLPAAFMRSWWFMEVMEAMSGFLRAPHRARSELFYIADGGAEGGDH